MSKQEHESTQPWRTQEREELRDQRRQAIVAAGLELCLQQGIAEVEMREVARQARVSRATLYRYFPGKRELIYAILHDEAANRVTPTYHAQRLQFAGTGLEKFGAFLGQLRDAYQRFPDFFRLLAMVEAYYGVQDAAADLAIWYQEIFRGLFVTNTPADFLREGQADGSVRTDLDPHLYLMTALATISSLAQHLAVSADSVRTLYQVDEPVTLLATAIEAMIRGAEG